MWFGRALTVLLFSGLWPSAAAAFPVAACTAAAEIAENAWGLPPGLLLAIGLAETGVRDEASGTLRPDPFSVNVHGTGVVFASSAYAVAAVAGLRGRGIASIDAGCFQVNLLHHPHAFASLADAFDPTLNAAAAARLLRQLFARTGSWTAAASAYHSADPARGSAYLRRVLPFWRAGAPARPGRAPADPHVILLGAEASAIPVYTAANLPAVLRRRLLAFTPP